MLQMYGNTDDNLPILLEGKYLSYTTAKCVYVFKNLYII